MTYYLCRRYALRVGCVLCDLRALCGERLPARTLFC